MSSKGEAAPIRISGVSCCDLPRLDVRFFVHKLLALTVTGELLVICALVAKGWNMLRPTPLRNGLKNLENSGSSI